MSDTIYLVELMTIDGTLVGLEKFTIKELALAFIDDYSDSSIYCNLFEMDVVEFAEKFMNIELQEWQKEHLRLLEKLRSDGDVRIVTGRKGQVYIYLDRQLQRELIQHG